MSEYLSSLIWRQFWQVSLLIPIAIFAIRLGFRRANHLGYFLLLLVLLKTITPPIWSSPTGVFSWLSRPSEQKIVSLERSDSVETFDKQSELEVRRSVDSSADLTISDDQNPESSASPIATATSLRWNLSHLALSVWGLGVVLLVGYLVGKRGQMRRFHEDTRVEPSDELLEAVELVSAELGLVKVPSLLVTLHPTVPFATGIFHPIVVLPAHLVEKSSHEDLKLILAHEMTHLRRGDTFIGAFQLFVQILWWFHPFVWWLNRELRRLREECCDSDVVAQLNCVPASYARCLLNMLELHRRVRPAPELIGLSPFEVTQKRLKNIMALPRQRRFAVSRRFGLALSLLSLALFVLPGAPLPARVKVVSSTSTHQDETLKNDTFVDSNELVPESSKNVRQQLSRTAPEVEKTQRQSESPRLNYDWIQGEVFQYEIQVIAKHPTETRTYFGSPSFRIATIVDGFPGISISDADLEKTSEPREGVVIPVIPDPSPSSDSSTPFTFAGPNRSGFPGIPSHRRDSGAESLTMQFDAPADSLPYNLGALQNWIFPNLPERKSAKWSNQRFLSGGWNQSATLVETVSALKDLSRTGVMSESITFDRQFRLTSDEFIDGDPKIEVTLTGISRHEAERGFLEFSSYSGQIVERDRYREVRIPLTIKILRATSSN